MLGVELRHLMSFFFLLLLVVRIVNVTDGAQAAPQSASCPRTCKRWMTLMIETNKIEYILEVKDDRDVEG